MSQEPSADLTPFPGSFQVGSLRRDLIKEASFATASNKEALDFNPAAFAFSTNYASNFTAILREGAVGLQEEKIRQKGFAPAWMALTIRLLEISRDQQIRRSEERRVGKERRSRW